MTDRHPPPADGEADVLAELEAEVAQDLADERPPAGGAAYQVVGALVGLVLGAVGTVLALGYGLGSPSEPGPGLWPFVVSVLIVGLSVVLLVVGRGLDDSERFSRASLQPVIGVVSMVAMGFAIPVIGFELPALAMCVVWLRFIGGETWRSTAVVSVVTVASFYALFLYGLRIPLPHLF